MELFKTIEVWRKVGNIRAVRYRCFQSVKSGKYSVQSADFYSHGGESPEREHALNRQLVELFVEQSPEERSGGYDTLEAAIEAHEAEFGTPE